VDKDGSSKALDDSPDPVRISGLAADGIGAQELI
jgi:hypothetical protein